MITTEQERAYIDRYWKIIDDICDTNDNHMVHLYYIEKQRLYIEIIERMMDDVESDNVEVNE